MISARNASVSGSSNAPYPSTGANNPRIRVTGGEPTLRCRSLPSSRTSRPIRSCRLPSLTITLPHLSKEGDPRPHRPEDFFSIQYLNSQTTPAEYLSHEVQ